MAILTTVGLATGAALAAENFIFNYSKNEYVQKINVLESQVNALQEHIATMTELRERISSFWDDDNARTVYKELNDTISETVREMESVKTYIRSLNTVVNEMSGSQGVMTQTLQDLSSAIRAGIKG